MKNLLIILFAFLFLAPAQAFSGGKSLEEQLVGTWRIKNVQKMQGMVIRTKKYTKDGGDPKSYIKRFKGGVITFNADSTVTFVSPNGKRTAEGTWAFVTDTKYRVKAGTGASSFDNGHTADILILEIKFPTARSFNIDGEYKDQQFGLVKVQGKFAIIDPKYMFKFERVEEEGEEKKKK